MARPADKCDRAAERIAKAHEAMAEAWRDYKADKVPLEPCDLCAKWLPGSSLISEVITTPDGYEECHLTCIICNASKRHEGDW